MGLRTSKLFTVLTAVGLAGAACAYADPAPFDLAGPDLEVTVTRAGRTLPLAAVPNLAAGDRLAIKSELPDTQSARYLMVAAFLRGSTNPPPESWFFRCETWAGKCAQEGLALTVPRGAQQVLLFLAPSTSGDFKTLVNAVRGRPGAFVRATQDLNQATLDRQRLEIYLAAIRALNRTDVTKLRDTAPLLARSLAIKVDEKCMEKSTVLQAPCLMQGQSSLILDDGHSTSIVEALTAGPASDLAMAASSTAQLNYGYYSPYIASVLDIARIMDSFHTAQYQYIPALASQRGEQLALVLNTPPSFHNPKSVLVIALPAVEQSQPPPLHAVNSKDVFCARRKSLVLPVEGAPLVFSTAYAHDMSLTLAGKDGKSIDLPANADSARGGFVVDTSNLNSAALADRMHGSLHGSWGFDEYRGPEFEFVNAQAQNWQLGAQDAGLLVAGREATVHLQAGNVGCVESVMLVAADGRQIRAEWNALKPNELEVKLPLQRVKPGSFTLLVTQFGATEGQSVPLRAFSDATRLERFAIHAGDTRGVLTGTRLDEVVSLSVGGAEFIPGAGSLGQGNGGLVLVAQDPKAAEVLQPADALKAQATLQDGRVLDVDASVDAPRPNAKLIDKSVQLSLAGGDSNIELANQDLLPQDARLTFSIRMQAPRTFSRDAKIEVTTADESFSTTLSLSNGAMTLENSTVALAMLDPAKAFGASAFGPLQFRVLANAVAGEWQPLATLVRVPLLKDLKCPATPELICKLTGANLYLLDSISGDSQFSHPVRVPDGFPGAALPVPRPIDGRLYVKLRDDPSVVNRAALTAQQLAPAVQDTAVHAVPASPSEPASKPPGEAALRAPEG